MVRKFPLILACMALTGLMAHAAILYRQAPVEALRGDYHYRPQHAASDRTIGLESSHYIPLEEYPDGVLIALFVTEDINFFEHPGVSVKDIRFALQDSLLKGKPLRGASTITQQLAKNVFLGQERSYYRKFAEMIYALKLEQVFSKREILALYASMAETAPGVYGMEEGAQFYFGKSARELDATEAGFLAAILRAPGWSLSTLKDCADTLPLEKRVWSSLYKSALARRYLMLVYERTGAAGNFSPDFIVDYLSHSYRAQNPRYTLLHSATLALPELEPEAIKQETVDDTNRVIHELCARKFK